MKHTTTQASVAQAIRIQRVRAGIASEAELARRAGFSPSALNKRLAGDIRLDLEDVARLAEALGLDPFELLDLAREVLPIAKSGLAARARFNASGDNETGFLETLEEIVASGKVPAQRLLDHYHGEWGGDVSRVYKYSF